jgi:aminoglycoside phosphotransferase (APT) family kinase protein
MIDAAKTLAERIRIEFPELQWEEYRYVDVGVDHEVIILDEQWVFRIPRNHADDLSNEIGLLNYLADRVEAGIPVYQYVSNDQCLAGYPFLEGRELSREVFAGMTAADQQCAAEQLARFLTDFHGIPIDDVSAFNLPYEQKPAIDLKISLDVLSPIFGTSITPAVTSFVDQFNSEFDSDCPTVFLHGELNWEHIMWDESRGRVNSIDISACVIGDPARDFAELWSYGERFIQQVYQLYNGPKYSALLRRAALIYKAMPINALKYWVSADREVPESSIGRFRDRWPELF